MEGELCEVLGFLGRGWLVFGEVEVFGKVIGLEVVVWGGGRYRGSRGEIRRFMGRGYFDVGYLIVVLYLLRIYIGFM